MKYIHIAIDGPAGSGKSTIAKLIAKQLDFTHIDTGAMYRAITLKALELGVDIEVEDNFKFAEDIKFEYVNGDLYMDDRNVSTLIRKHKISNNVSLVSSYLSVRNQCVKLQRKVADDSNLVMDGRDIGTVVLPDANYKFFLIASIEKRAGRRYKDNIERGITSDLEVLKEKIAKRDKFDSSREHSPLRPADDAIIIDTSDLSIEQVVALITEKIREVE